jgi:phosphoribosyl-ATP pyrophosphohydrolase
MNHETTILARLMAVLEDRKVKRPANSYTTQLFDAGIERIGAKVCEEANEVVEAARQVAANGRTAVIHEAADVLYHLLVLLAHCEVTLSDVEGELARRFGISGLEEKASRKRRTEEF